MEAQYQNLDKFHINFDQNPKYAKFHELMLMLLMQIIYSSKMPDYRLN